MSFIDLKCFVMESGECLYTTTATIFHYFLSMMNILFILTKECPFVMIPLLIYGIGFCCNVLLGRSLMRSFLWFLPMEVLI